MHHQFTTSDDFQTVDAVLRWRAERHPTLPLFTFLNDGQQVELTCSYAEIDRMARSVAGRLQQANAYRKPVLLVYPSSLEYLVAFFGCLYAGAIAVPVHPPRRHRVERLCRIAADSGASIALTSNEVMDNLRPYTAEHAELDQLEWLISNQCPDTCEATWREPDTIGSSIAFLQYTSGSTGTPKGVMVSHRNLLHNQQLIANAFGLTNGIVTAGWLPFHHDMGLIGNVLQSLYQGAHFVFITPTTFLQKPVRWLQMITNFKATISGGPNFAYELCCDRIADDEMDGLDLRSWEIAFNGAEPVSAETLRRFSQKFLEVGFLAQCCAPCYGMAETTLLISGSRRRELPPVVQRDNGSRSAEHVSCGVPDSSVDLRIVDPTTLQLCDEGVEGEIWVASDSVTAGYWNKPESTEESFANSLVEADGVRSEPKYFRSGDLGFVQDDHLYVSGRIKDLIIIRGMNHHPQDIELTSANSHPALAAGCAAAFDAAEGVGQVVVVQELKRSHLRDQDFEEIMQCVRSAVLDEHQIALKAIVLVRPGGVPKTTSGKTQRRQALQLFQQDEFRAVAQWCNASAEEAIEPTADSADMTAGSEPAVAMTLSVELQRLMTDRLTEWLELAPDSIDINQRFSDFAVDSVTAVRLGIELEERLRRPVEPTLMFDYPTISALSAHLASEAE